MNSTLQGVIVGGIFASLGTIATLVFQYKKWKKEKRIEHLRNERTRLEPLFKKILEQTNQEMKGESMDSDVFADILYLCPEKVKSAYIEFLELKDPTVEEKQESYFSISSAMKESLAEIDHRIERELDLKIRMPTWNSN